MEAEDIVETETFVLGDAKARARALIVVVGERRDEAQSVGATAKKHSDERSRVVARATESGV
jgi:hypothetical protein